MIDGNADLASEDRGKARKARKPAGLIMAINSRRLITNALDATRKLSQKGFMSGFMAQGL